MFNQYTNLIYFVGILTVFSTSYVCADIDLRTLFGDNVNSEEGWAKLFELEKCPKPQKWEGNIIMVNESLSAGAKFLTNPNVSSRFECEFECCYKQKDGCNVAIYSAKQQHCYLFDCGKPSKCIFDQHDGYTVSLITDVIMPKTTKPEPSTTEAPATSQPPAKRLHLLDGCRPDVDTCVTENSECSNTGFCTCKKGHHPKNGVCRKDCLDGLQFECTNGDPKYARPDCIAVYDVCDGSPQCPDGSDELDCKDTKIDWAKLADDKALKAKIEEFMGKHSTTTEAAKTPAPTKTVETVTAEAVDLNAIFGKINKSITTKKPAAASDEHEDQLTNLRTTADPAPTATVDLPHLAVPKIDDAPVNGSAENKSVLSEEGWDEMTESSRSAVVALSLSLTLTIALVAYLGCRYRSIKARSGRRGKALNGSEVDYLIDGMYL